MVDVVHRPADIGDRKAAAVRLDQEVEVDADPRSAVDLVVAAHLVHHRPVTEGEIA